MESGERLEKHSPMRRDARARQLQAARGKRGCGGGAPPSRRLAPREARFSRLPDDELLARSGTPACLASSNGTPAAAVISRLKRSDRWRD
jgi:hypothetical protein